jgi:hypothetical protein
MTHLSTAHRKTKPYTPSHISKKQPTIYDVQRLESPVNTGVSASYKQDTTSKMEPVMQTKSYNTPFAEFIKRDDSGRYQVRLGPQTFSTNYKLTDIRIESVQGSLPVSDQLLKAKPWILRNLKEIVTKQRKKERAEMFSKECFQRTPYSANQRISYHNAKSN